MRDYVSRLLRRRWNVETVANGADALEAARRSPPHLILSDVMMPVLDGFGLLREVRKDPVLRSVSFILLSARAGEEARVEGLEAGADDYLPKPFSARELLARVGIHLHLSHMREALERERRSADAANAAKDEFLAMLGHELRNPLAPIKTALQLMRLRGMNEGGHERSMIERQVQHLVRLVDDLLDVSRITRGKVELSRALVEIDPLIARAIEVASPLFEQRRHNLVIDVAPGLVVDGDADRLSQIVANLLTNAAKYTPEGGRVTITARREGTEVLVAVEDSGVGIGAELLPRVFDLFVQGRQGLDRAQGGLGLGLAIVRRLVELHGGRVAVESAGVGQGSRFTVHLPVVTGEAPLLRRGASVPSRAPSPAAKNRRVLIVDDNRDGADILAASIDRLGYSAEVAYDGPSALEVAARFRPHVALLDIGLPVMDGHEVARRLRENADLRGIRMIALTGYGQPADRRKAMEAGFDHHVVKPIDLDALVPLLDEVDL